MSKIESLLKNYLMMSSGAEHVAVIHNPLDRAAGLHLGPKTVALIEVDASLTEIEKCELAFMMTNTIDCSWWNDLRVTVMTDTPCRSTSTGDQVLLENGKKYTCGPYGWVLVL